MTQELQARDKMAVKTEGEQTRPRPVFVPAVDIYESEDALTLVADLPGVQKDKLLIDLKDDTLTIKGEISIAPEEGRVTIYREYQEGDYARQFTLGSTIDQSKINGVLKDGVLTLVLPKVEKAKPRQIQIRTE